MEAVLLYKLMTEPSKIEIRQRMSDAGRVWSTLIMSENGERGNQWGTHGTTWGKQMQGSLVFSNTVSQKQQLIPTLAMTNDCAQYPGSLPPTDQSR